MSNNDNVSSKPESFNKGFPIPKAFVPALANPPLKHINPIRVFGQPVKLDVQTPENGIQAAYSFIYKDNFTLGALWGLLSGYCTGSLLRRNNRSILPNDPNFFTPQQKLKFYHPFKRVTEIGGQVVRRVLIAGLLFDFVEQHVAKQINHSKTTTDTLFGGLAACALAFRLCNPILNNIVYTTAVLGGYLAGAKIPPAYFYYQRLQRITEVREKDRSRKKEMENRNKKM